MPIETARLTSVAGLLSADAGQTYGAFLDIAVPADERGVGSVFAPDSGQLFFQPCTNVAVPARAGGYFGDYNGGTFLSDSPADLRFIAAWGDSREGCVLRGGDDSIHQHVFSGGRLLRRDD